MIKVGTLKEVKLVNATAGHLLLVRQQGAKFAIRVHRPEAAAAQAPDEESFGLITLSPSPMVRWRNPVAVDAPCVDLGPFEIVFGPKLEAFLSGSQHFVSGALIVEPDGPALICSDSNGAEVRIGISNWRLRVNPVLGTCFYVREWQLGIIGTDDSLDILHTHTHTQTPAPAA